jgi:prevent-host-death family protein
VKTWPRTDAKDNLIALVDRALNEGPQTITSQGAPVAIILSPKDFKRLAGPKESPLEFFAPLKNSGIRLMRDRSLPRKAEL